jgi:plastocyanin
VYHRYRRRRLDDAKGGWMMRRVLFVAVAAAALLVATPPAHAGGYCADPDSFQDHATNQVVMKAACFGPTVARIDAGDELTFRNVDGHAHTVGGVAGTFGDAHKEVPAGESVTFRFDDEGVYPFFCVLHPGMAGAVVVGDGATPGAAGVAAVPVEPASASHEEAAAPSDGFPFAFAVLAIISMLALALGIVATTVVLRRRQKALDTA